MYGASRSLLSFSSDTEPDVDLSTSDDAVVASFAWRSNSVPDIDDGRLLVMAGDLTPGRPSVEDVDVTRVSLRQGTRWRRRGRERCALPGRRRSHRTFDCTCGFYGGGRWDLVG